MKFLSSVPFLVCSLLAATGVVMVANALTPTPAVLAAALPLQDAAKSPSAPANLSGTWQMAWTGENGAQRQASMEIKQNGSKLSGNFEGQRGTAKLSGTLDGDQVLLSVKVRKREVSFTGTVDGDKMSGPTARGGTWTATRAQQQ